MSAVEHDVIGSGPREAQPNSVLSFDSLKGLMLDAKRAVGTAYFRARSLTGFMKSPPGFLIIGGQKCGTTSLHQYLSQHPQTAPMIRKAVHYFDLNYQRPISWYTGFSPLVLRLRRRMVFESSPYYLFHPHCPERVRRHFPDTKLIVLLRNPTQRCYSHYQHNVRLAIEHRSFPDALKYETDHMADELQAMLADPTYNSLVHRHYSYRSRGRYAEQISRWLGFFSASQLHIIDTDDLKLSPQAEMLRLCDFLGVAPLTVNADRAYNIGSYKPLPEAMREELDDYYRIPNRELLRLLGRGFNW